MGRSAIDEELHHEIAGIAASVGCSLQHVELHQGNFRVFLDHPEGVTLEHCEKVSKQLSAHLDVTDFGRGRYVLEVSSPGLDRRLFAVDEFERFLNHKARITFHQETGGKRTIVGTLLEVIAGESEPARIVVLEDDRQERLMIPHSDIETARLVVDL